MRLINQSAVDQAELNTILQFVTAYIPSHKRVVIVAADTNNIHKMATGWAGLDEGRAIIKLNLRPSESFRGSYWTREVDTVPYMQIRSWEEEVVLVAAHELRHAEQILAGTYAMSERLAAETDAELFAGQVLDAYRRRQLT